MNEEKAIKEGKLLRAVELMVHRGVKPKTIAKTLKIDEVDAMALIDTVKKNRK